MTSPLTSSGAQVVAPGSAPHRSHGRSGTAPGLRSCSSPSRVARQARGSTPSARRFATSVSDGGSVVASSRLALLLRLRIVALAAGSVRSR